MEFEESLRRVVDRWRAAFDRYETLKAASEPAVVRREWTTGERHNPLPHYYNRYPGRPRALKGDPTEPGYYYRYGFDVEGRPRLHRVYNYLHPLARELIERDRPTGFERDDLGETFYLYSDARIEIIEFSVPPRIPLDVQQIDLEEGRAVRLARFRLNGYTPLFSEKGKNPDELYEWLGPNGRIRLVERYVYEGDRLASILVDSETPGIGAHAYEERFTYDPDGKLARIDRFHAGVRPHLVYRRRVKGETFGSIRKTATRMLIDAVADRLAAERIVEKVCFIELSYRAGDVHFPPLVIIGLEEERRRTLASDDPDAPFFAFNPAMLGPITFVEIDDPATLEICDRLEQEIREEARWTTATRILRDAAAELTRRDWSGILDVTPDFVVFAIDWEMEGDDLEEILAASASREQIQVWKRKGWLDS